MFTNPEQNILRLGLKEGMRVADFGAGVGFNSKICSYRVGQTGKVYAIEVQKELVRKLESELKHWGLSNVDCIWGDIEVKGGTKLADNSVNAVIISNVLSQAEDKLGVIDEARRILKKDGKVLLVDWLMSFSSRNSDNFISMDKAKDLFTKRGFKFVEEISTTEHHYGIIFTYE